MRHWFIKTARIIGVLVAVAYGVITISYSINNVLMFIVAAYCTAFVGILAYAFWVYVRIRIKADDEEIESKKGKNT